ncbi:MAG: hypothetical protein AAF717_15570 [Bacteroidota bacterium]
MKKEVAFKIAASLLVVVLFVLVEIGLRLSGYGTNYPLFIAVQNNPEWIHMNPEISKKYFGQNGSATIGFQEMFKKDKDLATFRIFVLGASTAVGYPYKRNGSFHRWLQFALNTTFPNKKIEIINLALTAVNSYTVLDFTKQLMDYQPDAILIYAGHNEYYGALGVGASNAIAKNPRLVNLGLGMKKLRLVQVMESMIGALGSSLEKNDEARKTLMEKMVADGKISFGSRKYEQGIQQFNHNLKRIAGYTGKSGIPVFISTLVSNEKDLSPFVSDSIDPSTAADHYFDIANKAYRNGNEVLAKQNYVLAKEYDQLRFRAPEALNNRIKALADSNDHIFIVDTHSRFETFSEGGILGDTFFWEHVHPNLEGYSLLAYTFYEAILDAGILGSYDRNKLSWEQLKQKMPVTCVDEFAGKYEVLQLKEGWPFYQSMPQIERDSLEFCEQLGGKLATKLIGWEEAMQTLYVHYRQFGQLEKGIKVAEGLILEYPYEARFHIETALQALKLNDSHKMLYHFKRASELDSSAENIRKIAVTLIDADAFEPALSYLEYMEQNHSNDLGLQQLYKTIQAIVFDKGKDSTQLAKNFLALGKRAKAVKILNKIVQQHPNNKSALELLQNID